MINIKYIYNRNKKTTIKNPTEFTLSSIERDAHKLFSFGSHPLIFYYCDDSNCKILLLNDDHVDTFCQLALSRLMPTKIFLSMQEKVISEIGDLKKLETVFTKKYLHNQHKLGQFSNKRLIYDLHSLKESLKKTQLKNNQIKKLIFEVSKNIKSYFVDECFDNSQIETSEMHNTWESINVDGETYSSILEKQTESSFFSRYELNFQFENIPHDMRRKDKNKLEAIMDQKVFCRLCKMDMTDEIMFVCETCENFVFCEECNQQTKHKHPRSPVFIINDSERKTDALKRVFRKLIKVRKELAFEILRRIFRKK